MSLKRERSGKEVNLEKMGNQIGFYVFFFLTFLLAQSIFDTLAVPVASVSLQNNFFLPIVMEE